MKPLLVHIRLLLVLAVLCCVVYPALVWGAGLAFFPRQAEGSLVRRTPGGPVVGSSLIGQAFSSPGYFHPRPSAVGYNAAGSAGSNLAPSNPALAARMADATTSATALDALTTATVAADRVYASGSGLDPDITPANARQQAARVARERGLTPAAVASLVERQVEPPLLGVLGPDRVNVLALNLALDAETSRTATASGLAAGGK